MYTNIRIGYAIAERLGQKGASVVISSRKENNVKEATDKLKSSGLDVVGTVCHVGKAEDRKHLIEYVFIVNIWLSQFLIGFLQALKEKGGIDILVSNAAVNPYFGNMLGVSLFACAGYLLIFEWNRHPNRLGIRSVLSITVPNLADIVLLDFRDKPKGCFPPDQRCGATYGKAWV